MWISYVELAGITDYNVYKTRINHMFDSAVNLGLNTILFQVRPYGDALYPSKIFPWSHIIGYKTSAGKPIQGVDPGYDPLGYAVAAAHARGLKLQAWVNPYRIFISGGTVADLAPNNPAKIWLTDNNPANDTWVRTINGIMYYNPAVPQVQQLIIDGIKEIVQNYAVDGVHFDDYFYPTTATTFDDTEYNAYKLCGGSLSLGDWRRKNVNDLVSGVYTAVHSIRDIPFGISPQARIAYVHDSCYADLPLWATTPGYVDYLCPEIYFGFQNQTYPFLSTLSAWDCMMTNPAIKLYIGLPAYKLGNVDNNAGTGKYEFQTSTEILKRMVQAVRMSNAAGFVLYSYSATVDPKNTAEITALKAIMNN